MMNMLGTGHLADVLAAAAIAAGRPGEMSLLLKATLVLLMGLASVRLARNARASVRHLALSATFFALFLLPVAAISSPRVTIGVPTRGGQSVARPGAVQRTVEGQESRAVEFSPASASVRWPMRTRTALRTIVAGGAILVLISLAMAVWRLSKMRRAGLPWLEAQPLVHALCREGGIDGPVDVLLHENVVAPLTCGVRRSAILLPIDARAWNDVDLRRALVHELEHVRRADWLVQLAARVVCAVYWFHPLVWISWRQLCLEAERSADDAVLQRAERTEYAEQLVLLARRLSTAPGPSALGMANRSHLAERVSAILDARLRRGRVGLASAVAAVSAAALVALTIAPVSAVGVRRVGDQAGAGPAAPRAAQRRPGPFDRALVEAAEDGSLEDVTEILNAGGSVNAAIDGDGSPLIAAARKGRLSIVRLLVERGANVDMPVPGDGSPLIVAAGAGHLAVVAFLLERGADVEQIVPGDENALIAASGSGHLQVVQQLVAWRADVNARAWASEGSTRATGEWRTALSMARRGGHDAVERFLLLSGARQ